MNPEDTGREFERAFNAGKLDELLALYEPAATLVLETGPVSGTDAIRDALSGFLSMKAVMRVEIAKVVRAGELALLSNRWTLARSGPDGQPVEIGGQSAEVVRRRADGMWRYVIDCPLGLS